MFSCGNDRVPGSTKACLAISGHLQRSLSKTLLCEFLLPVIKVAHFGQQVVRVHRERTAVGVAAAPHVRYIISYLRFIILSIYILLNVCSCCFEAVGWAACKGPAVTIHKGSLLGPCLTWSNEMKTF